MTTQELQALLHNAQRGGDGTYIISTRTWPQVAAYFNLPPSTLVITPRSGPFKGTRLSSMARFHALAPTATDPTAAAAGTVAAGLPSGLGGLSAAGQAGGASNPFQAIIDAVNSVEDFLKFISWLFYPGNWLRAVEFLTGLVLFMFGVHSTMQGYGERRGRFYGYGGVIRRSPFGRVLGAHHETERERVRRRGIQRGKVSRGQTGVN